jgi:GNAT superfamily N-acetyltransferase
MTIRQMLPADIPSVVSIQSQCYLPGNIETEAVIRARLACSPDTAWVAEVDGEVCAYLVGYRSRLGQVGALGDGFEPATEPDCLYLHDLAVGPQARGLGLGPLLVAHALAQASREHLPWAALVSVQGSQAFWRQRGFTVSRLDDRIQGLALASYAGGPACYMTQPLSGLAVSCQTEELAYSP